MSSKVSGIIFIGILILIVSSGLFVLQSNNDYMEHKDRNCVVLDKMKVWHESFHSGSVHYQTLLYLILKDDTGLKFDLIVGPTTYSQTKIGEKCIFNLPKMDMKQTLKDNIIWFVLPCLLMSVIVVLVILAILLMLDVVKWEELWLQ